MAGMTLDIELHSATVRPGHTLLVSCSPQMTVAQADQLKADLEQQLPGVVVVMVKGAIQLLVYEPDEFIADPPL